MHYALSLAITSLFTAVILLPSSGIAAPTRADSKEQNTFTTIEWPDLIPPETLEVLMNPPQYITEMEDGSAEDQIANKIKNAIGAASDDPYQQALSSTEVNTEMDGAMVRLPGFVVPLEFDDDQVITQFFLVPYFGACLHMPPPPPNQIILVDSPQGLTLDELYTPVWVSGVLSASVTEYEMATAAYALTMSAYEDYEE